MQENVKKAVELEKEADVNEVVTAVNSLATQLGKQTRQSNQIPKL